MSSKHPPKNEKESDNEGEENRRSVDQSEKNSTSGEESQGQSSLNQKMIPTKSEDGPFPVNVAAEEQQQEERKMIPAKRSRAFLDINELLEKEKKNEEDDSDDSKDH
ncbi:hypothetical protein AVEN_127908-1 [Araneus ventricosus]|uniref:Uncharacterized protein n=1 Tax=Araneus ventricosus TaxID=182803 RepID=A0A4Y1ZYV0_ARAVE|nr:hypothetical protein AVEN_127908-1 [Araneus ventricosus]